MQLSDKGSAFIRHEEGFRADAYQDQVAIWTVGFGETRLEGRPVRKGDHLSLPAAQALFDSRIARLYAPAVATATSGVALAQHQFDMLVSLAYNIGTSAFANSTLVKKLHAADPSAPNHFLDWVRGGGRVLPVLQGRRAREQKIFVSGYSDNSAQPVNGTRT